MFIKKTSLSSIITQAFKHHIKMKGPSAHFASRETQMRWAINEIKHNPEFSDYVDTLRKNGCHKGRNTETYVQLHIAYMEEIARLYPVLKAQTAIEIREVIHKN